VKRLWRGIAAAVRARPGLFLLSAAGVVALDIWLPPLLLSITRKPWTFFTFNPWLKQLPSYLTGPAPTAEKLDFLTRVALFWFSADGLYGAPEWGFAVDTMDVARFVAMGLLVGLYLVLLLHRPPGMAWRAGVQRGGGAIGALASVVGLSTGPCSVVGCGAPVLPAVGLVFAGLSSGTLALLSGASRVLSLVVFAALLVSVTYLAWQAGRTGSSGRREDAA
jgi:hypothetical protein